MIDLLVIGGGVNGVGIAAEAASRGLSATLVEADDLARYTSSGSSKLVHGGLRYLESYHFRLVGEALKERDVLLERAPHLVTPLRFVLPHVPAMRPAWMVRIGLMLYDNLWRSRHLPKARGLDPRRDPRGAPLAEEITKAFAYSDAWVDDARLVVANALFAQDFGATIRTRTRFVGATPEGEGWRVRLTLPDGTEDTVACRAIVNAAGPWVREVLDIAAPPGAKSGEKRPGVRLIRGSHIVTPRLHDGAHAYILQNDDGRVVFVLPYEGAYSLIGTTDVVHTADPALAVATPEEVAYLQAAVRRFFPTAGTLESVWSYAAVRPLYDDGDADPSSVTREYVLHQEAEGPPLLSVFGGKLTTYRSLSEKVLDRLAPLYPGLPPSRTATQVLPGGDLPEGGTAALVEALAARHPEVTPSILRGLAARHGTRALAIVDGGLGRDLGAGLTEGEVAYLRASEWAVTAEDILWRRTKCGLHMTEAQRRAVAELIA